MFNFIKRAVLKRVSLIHYRRYEEQSFHHALRVTLTASIKLAEKILREQGQQSIIIEHEDRIYTVVIDENNLIKTIKLQ